MSTESVSHDRDESEWKLRMRTPVGQQIQLADDLLQMTMSPLGGSDPADWALGELLHHPCPPVPWLRGVSRFAKGGLREGSLNPQMAMTLYFAAVASALVKRNAQLSRLSDPDLRNGFALCQTHDWVDKETCLLFEQAQSLLRPPMEDSNHS